MATNAYFNVGVKSEQTLYEDIIIESLQMYGQDVFYIPRELVNEDRIFGDDSVSKFKKSHKIEMYIENLEGFDGEKDLFSKFGVEIRDEATFVVARRRFDQLVGRNDIDFYRPREGDLIHLPMSNSTFEIQRVEDESPFYQLKNLPTFKMRCSLFEYNDEDFDTGVKAIDDIEKNSAYQIDLTLHQESSNATRFQIGEEVSQTLDSDLGIFMKGEVVAFVPAANFDTDSDSVLSLAHIGSTDGTFREFLESKTITGLTSGATGVIQANGVVEDNKISDDEQNIDFKTIAGGFLDFSESNPFGDVET
jgi:hypothetical protein